MILEVLRLENPDDPLCRRRQRPPAHPSAGGHPFDPRAARGGRTDDPSSSSRVGSCSPHAARAPEGNDQAATQRRRSEHRPDRRTTHPSLIASQQGMCSLDGRGLIERGSDQRFCWSEPMWSPPPESNRRPHPYHGTTRNRCADRRFPRSRPVVGYKVKRSLNAQLWVLLLTSCVLSGPSPRVDP